MEGKLITGHFVKNAPKTNPVAPNNKYVVPIVKVNLEPKVPKTGVFNIKDSL